VRRDALVDEHKIFPFPLGQSIVQIRTLDGSMIFSSVRLNVLKLPMSKEIADQTVQYGSRIETIQVGNVAYRLIDYLSVRPSLPPLILQVAVPLTMIDNERRQIILLFWFFFPLALGASALGGFMTAKRALRPVSRIIGSARAIQPHELSARVPVPHETEMKELALTLNDLLARLQKAFESQEQFIADASHQLKTPLAIIRGEIDVFLRRPSFSSPQDKGDSGPLLNSISQEINHLSKMVDDLLLLARFDGGGLHMEFTRVRLDEVIFEAVAQLSRLANEKSITLEFNVLSPSEEPVDLEMNGDANLLRALFFNLIENAIKYSPPSSKTEILLKTTQNEIVVEVKDEGPGIRPHEIERIFDRFHRGSVSQHIVGGVGLGLSIANRIAKFHNATLAAQSTGSGSGTNTPRCGTTFTFRIKKF